MTRFVVVPQWQGSPSTRGMLLIDGANAIAGDLPRSSTTHVQVPLEAGEGLDSGVLRVSALQHIRALITDALGDSDEHTVVIGGDCAVAVPPIENAHARHPSLAVVWCDAHGDLHLPVDSPSGAFGGMALRAVLGEGEPSLHGGGDASDSDGTGSIATDRVVLVGARDLDDAEERFLDASAVRCVYAEDVTDPEALADAVVATGADAVYVHIDLDVLDPDEISGVTVAAPFGVRTLDLVAAIKRLREKVPLVGASLTGFAPASAEAAGDDMGAVLRLIGALA